MAKIGVYIAHHRWLDIDFGEDRLYKVGYSTNLDRRLNDSSYTTCFIGTWRYKYVFLVNTQSEAEAIESYILNRAKRVEFKELVNNNLSELIAFIEEASHELNIRRVEEITTEPAVVQFVEPIVITPIQDTIIKTAANDLSNNGVAKINCDYENKKNIVSGLIKNCGAWSIYLSSREDDLLEVSDFVEHNCQINVLRVDKTSSQNVFSLMRQNETGTIFCSYTRAHLIHKACFDLCIFDIDGDRGKRAIYEMTKRPHFRNHVYISNTS